MSHARASAHWIPATLSLFVATVVGCGLSDITEGAFSGNGTTGSGGAPTGTSSSTSESSTATTSSISSTSSTGEGGALTTSTSTTSTTTTTTTGQPGDMLDCGGGLTCPQGPDNACCWDDGSSSGMCVQGPADPATCNNSPTNGGFSSRIECQLPSHCDPGMICCGDIENPAGFQYYPNVTCQAQCAWPGNRVLCDPQNPMCPIVTTTGGNTVQTVCQQSGILPAGYHICTTP